MLLDRKIAVIHGAGGAIGGAIARAFAREGARVHLAGRTLARLEAVATDIIATGGTAKVACVDALDEVEVEDHAAEVAWSEGRIDIAVNAVGFEHVQGVPFADLACADFTHPVSSYTQANFLTAQAAAKRMDPGGVILTLSTPGAKLAGIGFMGNGVASAAIEAFTRLLAAELGPRGIRALCLRPDAIPQALELSHTRRVFDRVAVKHATTAEQMLTDRARTATLLGRLPTLDQVADCAAFLASDRAAAMTGTIANLTCGSLTD